MRTNRIHLLDVSLAMDNETRKANSKGLRRAEQAATLTT